MHINDMTAALLESCVRTRRTLHEMPETAFCEFDTQDYILSRLSSLCPDRLEKIAGTGVKAVWYAPGAARTLAFRADMDALKTREETGAPYASKRDGVMHACGHDGHMTLLLMLAQLIAGNREALRDNVVLLFQPAEEGKCGARLMIERGALNDPKVDIIYGMHLWPSVPKGKLGVRWGAMMAHSCEFDIVARGVAAHGAAPQKGVDAIVAAAEFVSMLQSVITRGVDPHQDALLTIGRIVGGTARNVIADNVEMNGTVRVLRQDVYTQVMERLHSMADGVAMATGASFDIAERVQYPSVDNPRALVEDMYTYLDGMEDVVLVEPSMASEDFACYQREVPGLFMFLGVGGGRNTEPLHGSRFDFDEDALLTGVELYRRLLGIGEAPRA